MKCNNCPKVATLHITEIVSDEQVEEHHLCEDCAQKHLYEPGPKANKALPGAEEVRRGGGLSNDNTLPANHWTPDQSNPTSSLLLKILAFRGGWGIC